ncbi:MAG: hypothetical protein ACOCWQ_04780 [Nanoarchaeota archaeon]
MRKYIALFLIVFLLFCVSCTSVEEKDQFAEESLPAPLPWEARPDARVATFREITLGVWNRTKISVFNDLDEDLSYRIEFNITQGSCNYTSDNLKDIVSFDPDQIESTLKPGERTIHNVTIINKKLERGCPILTELNIFSENRSLYASYLFFISLR